MLNMDFRQDVVVNTVDIDWTASPMAGVWRKPLAREEAERGHATSIVKYDKGASFSAHGHPLGEEILVLDGTFSDETGHFHAGTYFRNPPGFSHAPFSKEGCIILVKLHQFQPDDLRRVAIDTHSAPWQHEIEGIETMPLHRHKSEQVHLVRWTQDVVWSLPEFAKEAEIYVIEGELTQEQIKYPAGTWLRSAHFDGTKVAGVAGTRLWLKTGHLNIS